MNDPPHKSNFFRRTRTWKPQSAVWKRNTKGWPSCIGPHRGGHLDSVLISVNMFLVLYSIVYSSLCWFRPEPWLGWLVAWNHSLADSRMWTWSKKGFKSLATSRSEPSLARCLTLRTRIFAWSGPASLNEEKIMIMGHNDDSWQIPSFQVH